MREEIVEYFKSLQDKICAGLEQADGKAKFAQDNWEREGGGGGRTRVIQNGNVIEKGGVNFSEVFGDAPKFLSEEPKKFFASGVSIVMHPGSPMVPIIHMNVRYLQLRTPHSELPTAEWFGGGIDLTPIYVDEDDARYFHQTLKATCDRFHPEFYPVFKKWADDYFFIVHRRETRGVGGVFFDHLASSPAEALAEAGPPAALPRLPDGQVKQERGVVPDIGWGQLFEFVMAIGNAFLPIYTHLIRKNKDKTFGDREKQWQLLRRGRYAEFNLVYDRGTKFGLETSGRTESILMSLPPQANWAYNFTPEKGSAEERTLMLLKKGKEWVR